MRTGEEQIGYDPVVTWLSFAHKGEWFRTCHLISCLNHVLYTQ